MAVVESVRGPVELGSLGQTLMHEHVFVLSTEHMQNYGSSWWDEEARVAGAIAKLNALYAKATAPSSTPRSGAWAVLHGDGRADARRRADRPRDRTHAPGDRRAHHRAHLGPHQSGRTAVRIFTEEGVDLSKVVIGHSGANGPRGPSFSRRLPL